MLRGEVPLANMVKAQKKSLLKRVALRLLGPYLVPRIEWTSSFFEMDAMVLLAHMRTTPVCLLGGINSLEAMERAMANGFAAVALARALLREHAGIEPSACALRVCYCTPHLSRRPPHSTHAHFHTTFYLSCALWHLCRWPRSWCVVGRSGSVTRCSACSPAPSAARWGK